MTRISTCLLLDKIVFSDHQSEAYVDCTVKQLWKSWTCIQVTVPLFIQ